MAESRQLSVRLSAETFEKLNGLKPEGVTLAEVARRIIEKSLGTGAGRLPSLTSDRGAGRVGPIEVNWSPFGQAFGELERQIDDLKEAQEELLRAVQEHGAWARRRDAGQKAGAVLEQAAKDDGALAVREWKKWTMAGRE